MELKSGCNGKVIQSLSDRDRDLKSIFKSNFLFLFKRAILHLIIQIYASLAVNHPLLCFPAPNISKFKVCIMLMFDAFLRVL